MNELVDGPVTVHVGDALSVLRQLPSESVHMVCTSPPYWGLRDYGTAEWESGEAECDHKSPRTGGSQQRIEEVVRLRSGATFPAPTLLNYGDRWTDSSVYRDLCGKCGARRIDSQLGLEPTPELYVEHLVEVFREVKRVLRRDGTCWLNLGDSYAGGGTTGRNDAETIRAIDARSGRRPNAMAYGDNERGGRTPRQPAPGLKPKDLVGIPWRVAFALQADGWWLRRDVIWAKPNPMPESVTDRPTSSHEYLFLLTRAERYYYDADAVREENVKPFDNSNRSSYRPAATGGYDVSDGSWTKKGDAGLPLNPNGRNLRSVWTIATQPYSDAHFATFPEDLVIPCIKAGTSEGGMVLDPFAGSGTTLAVARRLGRRAIGIELQADYLPLIQKRVEGSALPLLEIL